MKRRLCASSVFICLFFGPGAAHPIYVAQIQETITDKLTNNSVVVIARPTPENPFRFRPEVWLKGEPTDDLPPISFLVDSATRSAISKNPEDGVLFFYEADGENNWQRVLHVNSSVRDVLNVLMPVAERWSTGEDEAERFQFFAERLAHPDSTVRSLARSEVLQSRYGLMRTMKPELGLNEIQRALNDPLQVNFSPLYIAMLTQIDDPNAQLLVRRMFDSSKRLDLGARLTPWAVALIELDGEAGVEVVARVALRREPTTLETAMAASTALALHGLQGREDLRDAISDTLVQAAAMDPMLAIDAVAPLIEWEDWRAVEAVGAHLTGGSSQLGLHERFILMSYLVKAKQQKAELVTE